MKKLNNILNLLLCLLWLASCGGENGHQDNAGKSEETSAPSHEEDGHGHDEVGENSSYATLTAAQVKSIGIETGTIEQKQLTASLKANGTLRVPNQNRANINTLYAGAIQSIAVQPGDVVRKGQVVASLANPDFMKPQEEYMAVNTRLTLLEKEYERQKELSQNNAGALKNMQAADAELKTWQTRKNTLMQQIRLMGIDPVPLNSGKLVSTLFVKSPISGVVSKVNAEIGSYVDLTTTVAEVVDNSQLHLDLFVFEKDLHRLHENQLIHFTLTNAPGKEYDARIFSLGSSFEGESKAVTVHAKVLGNKTGLIDGMNITAIVSLEKAKVPAVPSEAIVNVQGQDFIFIVKKQKNDAPDQTTFEKIPVARGTTDIGYTEVTLLREVPEKADIVVKGAFFVSAKMANSGGGHAH